MPTTKSSVRDPHAPQLFRRATTLTWASIITVFFTVVATVVAVGYASHGFFPILAPYAAILPIVTFALMGMIWPHVIVRDSDVTVRNSFATYRVPYAMIKDVRQVRIGMLIEPHVGKMIPLTAYSSGSGAAKMFQHNKSATKLMDAIEDKLSYASPEATESEVTRTIETRNIIIVIASLAVTAIVIALAVATYH